MKATQFIKDHSLEKAREVVAQALEGHNKFDVSKNQTVEIYKTRNHLVDLRHLKRLVESVDYVLIHGYEKSKEIIKNAPLGAECYSWLLGNSGVRDKTVELTKLKQAIADYELIYGEEGASHE